MDLRTFCVRVCRLRGIELTAELEDAIDRWDEVFGRMVFTFSDFVDAIEMCGLGLGEIDLEASRDVWFEMHEIDQQAALEGVV